MKINFIFSAHSVKSHHVSVREPKLPRFFFIIIFSFFMFTVLGRRCCQEAQNIVFFFDKQTHSHTRGHDRFLRISRLRSFGAFRLRSISLYYIFRFPPCLVKEIPNWNVCQACPIRNCISLILLNVLFRCLCSFFSTSLCGFISNFCSLFGWNGIFRC